MKQHKQRNLGLDLVRATEAAAINAGRFMGLGERDQADEVAKQAMRAVLDTLEIDGLIVVGEEGKLDAPSLLDSGQTVGTGDGPAMDVVVDPIDGRRLLAQGQSGAIAVAAIAPREAMWSAAPAVYMQKIVVDREVAGKLVPETMDAPAAWTLSLIADVKGKEVRDLIVFVLDRPRHRELIEEIRAVDARVMLRTDGDIAGALLAATGKVDVLMGIGGVAEGVIAAGAVKSLGGTMLGRLSPQSDEEQAAVNTAGLDLEQVLTCDDIVSSNEVFFAATGITDGPLLDGVRYRGNWAETHSIILRCETQARRFTVAEHVIDWAPTPHS
ncbi:MAG: class II fructose-bisphosphatase [Anaerolineae bacterium]|nr:class II fructose-bisphosphatase [Anaerolineae bacterium]